MTGKEVYADAFIVAINNALDSPTRPEMVGPLDNPFCRDGSQVALGGVGLLVRGRTDHYAHRNGFPVETDLDFGALLTDTDIQNPWDGLMLVAPKDVPTYGSRLIHRVRSIKGQFVSEILDEDSAEALVQYMFDVKRDHSIIDRLRGLATDRLAQADQQQGSRHYKPRNQKRPGRRDLNHRWGHVLGR